VKRKVNGKAIVATVASLPVSSPCRRNLFAANRLFQMLSVTRAEALLKFSQDQAQLIRDVEEMAKLDLLEAASAYLEQAGKTSETIKARSHTKAVALRFAKHLIENHFVESRFEAEFLVRGFIEKDEGGPILAGALGEGG
jgi:hypothetical protein